MPKQRPLRHPRKRSLKSCHDGKQTFGTFKEAQMTADIIMRKTAKSANPRVALMKAYGCPCGKYHIGRTGGINWKLIEKIDEKIKKSTI